MNTFKILQEFLEKNSFTINNQILSKLTKYINLIINFNENIKLTSDNNVYTIVIRHILDSLFLTKLDVISHCETFLDIGSGAGFPGIPLNIYTKKNTTLIESNQKKAAFLNIIKNELDLSNISIINQRAEIIAKDSKYREKYDFAITRAFSKFLISMEIAFPFTRIGGHIIYFATNKTIEDAKKNFNKIKIFGCNKYNIFSYNIESTRLYFFYVKKMWKTPEIYPRKINKIR